MRLRRVDCSVPGASPRAPRAGLQLSGRGRRADPGRRGAGANPRARHPTGLDGRLDLPHPRGHIQATGYDDAGRKQYLYHDAWRDHRDREKFEQMEEFGRALPELRQEVERDLSRRGLAMPSSARSTAPSPASSRIASGSRRRC